MNQPTKEQTQWFWKQCGFKYRDCYPDGRGNWMNVTYPDGRVESHVKFELLPYPSIDLNNLFGYAVPKLGELRLRMLGQTKKRLYFCSVGGNILSHSYEESQNPALALFWSIYKAFGGK